MAPPTHRHAEGRRGGIIGTRPVLVPSIAIAPGNGWLGLGGSLRFAGGIGTVSAGYAVAVGCRVPVVTLLLRISVESVLRPVCADHVHLGRALATSSGADGSLAAPPGMD